jgi:N-acetylmuramoyl-L-alanine amidase
LPAVIPENSISGRISVSGRLDIVTATNERESYTAKDFETEVSSSGKETTGSSVDQKQVITGRTVPDDGKEFRVQVTASSEKLTADEVRKRTGLSSDQPLTVEKSGNIFKYQFGRFASYSDATSFLSEVNNQGVKGAFVVAYQSGKQVPVK